ncbi:MAG: DUF429 domain-containing protein [Candidatus Aenigmarchaeota archaeon]|nr:DUF429 domain-containing protein [Candidatus Aenigmarchaeota archaeon]
MKFVGIDLAGSEKRETGFCILDENLRAETFILFKDEEIIKEIEKVKPRVISIDAPLALPKGRPSLSKKYKNYSHLRECDKELLRMGIKFFPITLGPMRKLTERGIKLKKILEKKGFEVIETFPGAVQDLLKIPRRKEKEKLRKGLIKLGIKGVKKKISEHELDAITCALVGKFYLEGNYIAIGSKEEVLMILPKV